MTTFHAMIIGDEILSGRRVDEHFSMLITLLARHHFTLSSVIYLPDKLEILTSHLTVSLQGNMPTFIFGGIGSTPDDHTRQAAALASNRPLIQHPEGTAIIIDQFGAEAYPHRIKMAAFPRDTTLIPNPINRIAGFSLLHHHFLPGFPSMAAPMATWVMEQYYTNIDHTIDEECILIVHHGQESQLTDAMEQLVAQFPALSFSCLPSFGTEERAYPHLDLRVAGRKEEVATARDKLIHAIIQQTCTYEVLHDSTCCSRNIIS